MNQVQNPVFFEAIKQEKSEAQTEQMKMMIVEEIMIFPMPARGDMAPPKR